MIQKGELNMDNRTHENLTKFWDYEKNINFEPLSMPLFSRIEAHFVCENKHEWKNKIINQSSNKNCQECLKLCFKYPELEQHWDFNKNKATFKEVYANSRLEAHWKCPDCKAETKNKIYDKVTMVGCVYCLNKRVLAGFNDLSTRNPELLMIWDYEKNTINPNEVLFNSGIKVWWKCDFKHSYKTAIRNKSLRKNKCRECLHSSEPEIVKIQLLTKYGIDEKWLLDNYVQSPKSMDEIFNQLRISPSVLRKALKAYGLKKDKTFINHYKSSKRFKTNLEKYGEFNPTSFAVSPSKNEHEIFLILTKQFKMNVIQNDRKIIAPKEIDLWIPNKNIAIEFNGNYWHDKEAWLLDLKEGTITTRESTKTALCKEKNIKLFHIWEDEWSNISKEIDRIEYLEKILSS